MNDSNKPDYIPSFAEIRATLAEVAARQKENEALSKESWRQILELKAQMAKTDAQMAENAVQIAKTSKDIDKLRPLHNLRHFRRDNRIGKLIAALLSGIILGIFNNLICNNEP